MPANLAQELADYAASLRYDYLPEEAVSEAKKRIVDALGCGIGAFEAEPVSIARRLAQDLRPTKGSTLLGTRRKTSPDLAAFVNGIMVRYFDYNDTYLSKEPAHPSDNLGPCLSVADSMGAGGRDLILAVVLGYEIQCRLCDAADIRHRGWDHVCYGLVSSALAAAKLMGLAPGQMVQSINLALNSHITMRQVRAGELSMWKGCSFANAARNAVFSTLLASQGMTGPSPIFEGEMGFFTQVSGPFKVNVEDFGGRNGRFKICDTYLKFFPAEIHSQTAIWAALEARKEIEDPGQVVSVEIESHEAGYTILGKDPEKWRPTTKETADHSLPYIVGMALLEGRVDNTTYSPAKFTKPAILNLLDKTTVKEDKALTATYPEAVPNRVTVRLASGKTIVKQVDYHKGHPKNPMTNEDIEKKFRTLTKRYYGDPQTQKALRTLWNLDKVKDLSGILHVFLVK